MSKAKKQAANKFGANRSEPARRWRKIANNFKQSRDVREDRSTRQSKLVATRGTLPALESLPPNPRKKKYG